MPQAIAAAVVAISNAVATDVVATAISATGLELGLGTTLAVEAGISLVVQGAIYVGISAGIAALTAPNIPTPEVGRITKKQAIPVRETGWGRARLGGAYMLYEGNTTNAWVVLALHDGQIDGWENFYLHDDRVTLDGSGWVNGRYQMDNNPASPTYGTYVFVNDGQRYTPNHVQILTRTGVATETSYSQVTAAVPAWTSSHRGDGIASLAMLCNQGQAKYFGEDYPNGLPQPSASGRLKRIWDFRSGTQSRTNPATWTWSANPILVLIDYLLNDPHGPQIDYATKIAPVLTDLQAEANYCDATVALAAGGTEPRYSMGGFYQHSNHPADVIKQILATMDGFMAVRGDGALIIKAGRYDAPTVTLSREYILSYSWTRYVPDESAVNELILSFTSPLHDYTEVQTDSWQDSTDISARGVIRAQNMSLPWVQSNGQARRLAKRRMSQLGAQIRGTVKANLYGLDVVENRYFTLDIPDVACLTGLAVEIDPSGKPELDLMNMTVSIPWIAADPNVDAWNPGTEEGAGVALVAKASSEVLTPPTITSVVPTYAAPADGGGCRLTITLPNSGRADQTYGVRWKVTTEVSWVEATFTGPFATTGNIVITSGLVPLNATLYVAVELISGSGIHSDWSANTTVTTNANAALQTQLVPLGSNVLGDTEFRRQAACWKTSLYSSITGTVNHFVGTVGAYAEAYLAAGSTASGWFDIIESPQSSLAELRVFALPVTAGDYVYCSALTAFLSANGGTSMDVRVQWWDSTGTIISEVLIGTNSVSVASAADAFANYTRVGSFVTAPTNARYASMLVRAYKGTVNSDGHAYAAQPFLAKVVPGQTAVPAYTPGRADLTADNTLQNTAAAIVGQRSGATTGITWASTAPSSPTTGDIWIDTTTFIIKTWNGSAWVLSTTTWAQLISMPGNIAALTGTEVINNATLQAALTGGSVVPAVSSSITSQSSWATYNGYGASAFFTQGSNLVQNSTFVQGLNSWAGGGGQFGVGLGANGANQNPYVYNISPGNTQLASASFPVFVGSSYSVQCNMFAQGITSGYVRLSLVWLNGSGASVGSAPAVYAPAGSGWTAYKMQNQIAPTGAVSAAVYLDTTNAAITALGPTYATSGVCAWNQIKVELGAACTPWNDAGTTSALYANGTQLDALQPAEIGANVTGSHVALAVVGQNAIATAAFGSYASDAAAIAGGVGAGKLYYNTTNSAWQTVQSSSTSAFAKAGTGSGSAPSGGSTYNTSNAVTFSNIPGAGYWSFIGEFDVSTTGNPFSSGTSTSGDWVLTERVGAGAETTIASGSWSGTYSAAAPGTNFSYGTGSGSFTDTGYTGQMLLAKNGVASVNTGAVTVTLKIRCASTVSMTLTGDKDYITWTPAG